MNDALLPLLMEIPQRGSQTKDDLVPFWPRQKALAVAAVEMPVEAAFSHQLVDKQEAVATTVAPTQELHEVAMLEPADDPHLCFELLPPLLG